MKISNIFKTKKPLKEKPLKEKPLKEKPSKKKEVVKKTEQLKKEETRKKKGFSESYQVLKAPHITEKATDLAENNQYVFKVWPKSNKIEIKKAIKSIYGVDVLSVRIINIPSKKRRLGKTIGLKRGYKKAIIKIKQGQKIEVLPR